MNIPAGLRTIIFLLSAFSTFVVTIEPITVMVAMVAVSANLPMQMAINMLSDPHRIMTQPTQYNMV
ncbi:MAG: hypothetical protein WCG01_01095 [bacterium]